MPNRLRGLAFHLVLLLGVVMMLITPIGPIEVPAQATSSSAGSKPHGIEVLWYSKGVMERTARNHMDPRFAGSGDYVPTLRISPAEMNGCLTAVNWETRHWVAQNAVLWIDFWDPVQKRYERWRCRPADWQQQRHSTGSRQRFELDYETAVSVNAVPYNTTARLITVESVVVAIESFRKLKRARR